MALEFKFPLIKIFKKIRPLKRKERNKEARLKIGNIIYISVRDNEYLMALNELQRYLPKNITVYNRITNYPSFKVYEYDNEMETYYYIEFREPFRLFSNAETIDILLIKDKEQTPIRIYHDLMNSLHDEVRKVVNFNKITFIHTEKREGRIEDKYISSLYFYKDECIKEKSEIINLKIMDFVIEGKKFGNNCLKINLDEIINIYKNILLEQYKNILYI